MKINVSVQSPDIHDYAFRPTSSFAWQDGHECILQLLMQPWICTHVHQVSIMAGWTEAVWNTKFG